MPESENPSDMEKVSSAFLGEDVTKSLIDPDGYQRQKLHEQIDNDFGFHPATEITGPKHEQMRALMIQTAKDALDLVPDGPERQHMVEHLRMAMMYGNAGIAIRTPAPEPEGDSDGR